MSEKKMLSLQSVYTDYIIYSTIRVCIHKESYGGKYLNILAEHFALSPSEEAHHLGIIFVLK